MNTNRNQVYHKGTVLYLEELSISELRALRDVLILEIRQIRDSVELYDEENHDFPTEREFVQWKSRATKAAQIKADDIQKIKAELDSRSDSGISKRAIREALEDLLPNDVINLVMDRLDVQQTR